MSSRANARKGNYVPRPDLNGTTVPPARQNNWKSNDGFRPANDQLTALRSNQVSKVNWRTHEQDNKKADIHECPTMKVVNALLCNEHKMTSIASFAHCTVHYPHIMDPEICVRVTSPFYNLLTPEQLALYQIDRSDLGTFCHLNEYVGAHVIEHAYVIFSKRTKTFHLFANAIELGQARVFFLNAVERVVETKVMMGKLTPIAHTFFKFCLNVLIHHTEHDLLNEAFDDQDGTKECLYCNKRFNQSIPIHLVRTKDVRATPEAKKDHDLFMVDVLMNICDARSEDLLAILKTSRIETNFNRNESSVNYDMFSRASLADFQSAAVEDYCVSQTVSRFYDLLDQDQRLALKGAMQRLFKKAAPWMYGVIDEFGCTGRAESFKLFFQ